MTNETKSRTASRAASIAIAILVAALGLYLGMRMRGRASIAPPAEALAIPPLLAPDRTFPNVPISAEDGTETTTHALLEGKGAVVILIDVECRPCSVMTTRFQHRIDDGTLAREQVVGITAVGPETIRSYKDAKRLTFPIYSDPTRAFQREYAVMNYPLRLDVGRSLVIHAASFDAAEAVDPARLRRDLAR